MQTQHKMRYPGARWQIVFGDYAGMERLAVNELQAIIQRYHPYLVAVRPAGGFTPGAESHLAVVGTARGNPLIADLVARGALTIPDRPESYGIAVLESPWAPGVRVAAIGGRDPKGVLNGVADFGAKAVGPRVTAEVKEGLSTSFAALPIQRFSGSPAVENRGIWTWGYVIYDYRRYLDNMARLKMNMLVMWNDCAPLNAADIVAYAHERGIRVVFGFHWGWGIEGLNLASAEDAGRVKQLVIENYEREYAGLGADGIYFQTLTEHHDADLGGRSVASLVCDWVNTISRALWERHPDLYIQFGLHATSIVDRYGDLAALDPRMSIIWEDAGVTPYSYVPSLDFSHLSPYRQKHAKQYGIADVDGTIDYSKRLAAFRGASEFGVCPKGYSHLSWRHEFEHHGPFILGERSAGFIARRFEEKRMWREAIDALWMRTQPACARFYREVRAAAAGPMTSIALVEDDLFEHRIPFSVALHAETIWDPNQPDAALLETAMSTHYQQS